MPEKAKTREETKLALAEQVIRSGGPFRLRAWGTSMLPSIWPGDLLTIQQMDPGNVTPGDVLFVVREGRAVAHRFVEWRQTRRGVMCITRGDALPHDDPPVAASAMLGRVAGICRAGRSFEPGRRVSWIGSILAWMLSRWDRFRSICLRLHSFRQTLNREV